MKNQTKMKNSDTQALARNIVGATTTLRGEIVSEGDFRIDGKLIGQIQTKGKVVVGQGGLIEGEVICTNAEVLGDIKGKLEVSELLSLHKSAKVHADIIVNKLAIEPGAEFSGQCSMGPVIKDISDGAKQSQKESPKKKPPLSNYSRYTAMIIKMAVIIAAGVKGGIELDKKYFQERPVLTVALSLIAVILAMYLFIRDVSRQQP